MCRVELKVPPFYRYGHGLKEFPNVPCGVESLRRSSNFSLRTAFPNVPCGVERAGELVKKGEDGVFPNVPCGVERNVLHYLHKRQRIVS